MGQESTEETRTYGEDPTGCLHGVGLTLEVEDLDKWESERRVDEVVNETVTSTSTRKKG